MPIIVRLDSGFFDQKLLQVLETLEVGYIVAGKLYGDVQQYILQLEETAWGVSRNGDQEWHYVELGDGGAAGTSSAGPCSAAGL